MIVTLPPRFTLATFVVIANPLAVSFVRIVSVSVPFVAVRTAS